MNLKCIMLSEGNKTQRAPYCMIPIIGHSGKHSGCQRLRQTTEGHKGILGSDGNVLYPDCGSGYIRFMRFVKTQNTKKGEFYCM